MSILNYFFIGFAFTFIIDLLLGVEKIKDHPKIKKALEQGDWRLQERILCILIWPLAFLIFSTEFIKQYFRK
jgi:mannose/fructose/N-acetylgalactosamine-specific phosphotransferase system component IIC